MKRSLPVAAVLLLRAAPVAAQLDCADWGTDSFFREVTAEEATRCIEAGAEPATAEPFGATWLHVAARLSRDSAVIAILASASADVNARDEHGRTALHEAAAHSSRASIVGALVAAGADLEARDNAGNTPLHSSLESRPPWGAAARKLIELGADPTARNDLGRVADPTHCENWGTLAFAAIGDVNAALRCVESGWDVNARGTDGNTPLHRRWRSRTRA